MSRYKSEQTAYNPQKKKNVPIWRLDDYFALRKAANRLKESASTRRGKQ